MHRNDRKHKQIKTQPNQILIQPKDPPEELKEASVHCCSWTVIN